MSHPPPCLYQCSSPAGWNASPAHSLLIDNADGDEDEDETWWLVCPSAVDDDGDEIEDEAWWREQVADYPRHAGYATETVPPTGETSDDEPTYMRVTGIAAQQPIACASQPTESFTQLPLPPPPPPAGGSSRGVMPPPGPPPLPDQPNLASGGAGPEVMPPSGARPLPDPPSWTVPPEVNIVGELGDPAAHIAAARAGGNPMGSFTGLIAHGSQIQAHQVAAAAAAISAQEVQAAQNVLASAAQPAASTDDSGQPSEMPHLASATQPAAYSDTGSVTPQPAPLQAHQDAAAAAAILRSGRCCIS